MKKQENRKLKKHTLAKRILAICLLILVLLAGGMRLYFQQYYHAGGTAEAVLSTPGAGVTVDRSVKNEIAFVPDTVRAGIILYPGAKVDYAAYAPLLQACARQGILSVVVHMPCNFAFFDKNAAAAVRDRFPQVSDWYLAGHSLGGVVGGMYLEENAREYRGLILLASYVTTDLSGSELAVLSIYGSEDGVLNRKLFAECKENLPKTAVYHEIAGGNHAGFADYGPQKGDGAATIPPEAQLEETVAAITQLIVN